MVVVEIRRDEMVQSIQEIYFGFPVAARNYQTPALQVLKRILMTEEPTRL